MTRSEIIANHIATLRNLVANSDAAFARAVFTRAIYAALATPGCEAQGVRLVDLPHLAERVAEMADAHERVVGERDAARTLLNLVSEALSGGEAPVDRLPELVFAMGQRFAAAVDARDAARAARDEARAALAREEHAHGATIDERERAHEWADTLANQIADAAGYDIGEHSNLNNPWDNAQDALVKLVKEGDAYRTFALDVARHLAAPDAADLADKLTPSDLPALLDCVRGEYGNGRAAGDRARFARCVTDLTRALGGDERRPETWEDLVASVRAVRRQRDHVREQANECIAQLNAARAKVGALDSTRFAELEQECDEARADLAALRLEHEAWGAIIDATRKDRDAARAEVAALTDGIDAVIDRKRIADDKPEILHTLQRHYEMVCETAGKANDTIEDIGKVLKIDALESDDIVADVRACVGELTRLGASIHKAADAARRAERADVVAELRRLYAAQRSEETPVAATLDILIGLFESGTHEGAATPK